MNYTELRAILLGVRCGTTHKTHRVAEEKDLLLAGRSKFKLILEFEFLLRLGTPV